jgi:hypothetical protein
MTDATAMFCVQRWMRLLAPPADAELRAARLGRDLRRWQDLQAISRSATSSSPTCSNRRRGRS